MLQDFSLSALELVIRVGNSKTDLVGRSATIRLPATGEEGPCPVMDTRKIWLFIPLGAGPLLVHENGFPLARH